MENHSVKLKELSAELARWWRTQTDFKTKQTLAAFIKVHPVTLSGYFTGKSFPGAEVANRLYELTKINCLKPDIDSGEVIARQVPSELPQKGGRRGERSVVISLQRTICPFCGHQISAFRSCGYCGQLFAWANVPLEHGQPNQVIT